MTQFAPYSSQQWPTQPPAPKNGFGTTALVLGIIGAIFALIPIIGVIAWPMVIVGLVLGIIGIVRAVSGVANNKGVAISGTVLSLIGLLLCILYTAAFASAASDAPRLPQAASSPVSTVPAVEAPKLAPGNFTDGMYQVGSDIPAGRYKTDGQSTRRVAPMCYYSRTSSDSGELKDIIANDNFTGPKSLTLKDGEFVEFSGGCTWTKQ